MRRLAEATVGILLAVFGAAQDCTGAGAARQQSLDEWRNITAPAAPAPRVFVKGNQIRFYFQRETNVIEFGAHWSHGRIPTEGYRIHTALLRWNQKLPRMPTGERGWREATVIAGPEWNRLATNLTVAFTPATAGHGIYFQGFLADRLLYRDAKGVANSVSIGEQPPGVTVDRRY